jgi:hypothetical protein
MNAPGATENACTRGVVYTLVDFTLTILRLPIVELSKKGLGVVAIVDDEDFY